MAVTRIWPIKNNIHQVVSYAANKSKTNLSKYSDLVSSLHYAADKDKTNLESEQRLLVAGINCDLDIAAQQMIDTKEMYGKTGGIVAYHAYISFKPGEVTPEEAQQVAMEVANKMWGADYEIVVAAHLNANCVHCHIVINSVSMTDGRKMMKTERCTDCSERRVMKSVLSTDYPLLKIRKEKEFPTMFTRQSRKVSKQNMIICVKILIMLFREAEA